MCVLFILYFALCRAYEGHLDRVPRYEADGKCRFKNGLECPKLVGNIIFTTFLCKDKSYDVTPRCSQHSYMKTWAESVERNNLRAVVLYDELNVEFIAQFSSHHIVFRSVSGLFTDRTPNDRRFFIYNSIFPAETKLAHVLLSDVRDVEVMGNVFEFMQRKEQAAGTSRVLFIGLDDGTVCGNAWMKGTLSRCFPGKRTPQVPCGEAQNACRFPLLNAGVIGGNKSTLTLHVALVTRYLGFCSAQENCNMPAVNFAARQLECEGAGSLLLHLEGDFVNKLWGKPDANNPTAVVHHKWGGHAKWW